MKAEVQEAATMLSKKIDEMQSRLTDRLYLIAEHVAQRVGEDMPLLDIEAGTNNLSPLLSIEQLPKLKAFVSKYGSKAASATFENNTNIIRLWLNKVDVCCVLKPEEQKSITNQPWGHFEIREG